MSGGRSKQSWRSGEENIGQPISPRHLSGLIGDFIVANLNHSRQEAMRARVPADRVVNEICRSIGLVDADGERWVCGEPDDQSIGHAGLLVENDSNLPRPRLAEIDRREGVDGDQYGRDACRKAAREACVDCIMVGHVNVVDSPRPFRST